VVRASFLLYVSKLVILEFFQICKSNAIIKNGLKKTKSNTIFLNQATLDL